MKKSKKFLCLLLALVMAGSLLLLPAAAANTQSGATRYPTVYVHGLMGWGEHDQIYSAVRKKAMALRSASSTFSHVKPSQPSSMSQSARLPW